MLAAWIDASPSAVPDVLVGNSMGCQILIDLAPQRWGEEFTGRLPRGQLVVVPGAAHTVNYMAADALADLVREFLRPN